MSFWQKHLFKGITGVPSLPPTRSVASEYIDEEAELEDAMGNMSLSSDDEGSTRPVDNLRAHGRHIIDSEDEGALEDVGGRPADLRLGLEDKLKKLKVSDLKAILQDAERPLRAKAVKNELIASIMADDAAIEVYLARFPI
ncbi:hypothetical protein K438DRAFT_1983937 [Mycena galopus ATCC 62051]|nr:hypothetical protein K438DRAFT_1983937 [Mycena galopus ATCC 62051]